MEKSLGDGLGDGEMLGELAGDGEHGEEAGVGAQFVGFRELSGDWFLRNEGLMVIVCFG